MRKIVCSGAVSSILAAALMAQNPVVRNLSCQANSGSSSAYSCNMPAAPQAYTAGTQYAFQADLANTGAATINFNSLGAKTIKKMQGGTSIDLGANDIRAGQWAVLMYDGTNMQMLSMLGNGSSGGGTWGTITGTLANQADLQTALNGTASLSGSYANPSWITSLAWSKITGTPAAGVSTVFSRSGAITAQSGDYAAAQVTNAVDQTGSYANPSWLTSLAWSKITGTPAAGVSTVFSRSGAITAQSGDYAAAQVTNAVDQTGSYANPSWLTSLAWSKVTGVTGVTGCAKYALTISSGNWLVNGSVPVGAALALANATAQDIPLFTMVAQTKMTGNTINPTTSFSGTGITGVTASLGWTGGTTVYAPALDVYQPLGGTISACTNASPTVCTTTAGTFATGDVLAISGATGLTNINGNRIVTLVTSTTFTAVDAATGAAINGNGTFGGTVTFARYIQQGGQDTGGHFSATMLSHNVNLHLITTGANVSALTSGGLNVWACTVTLP